jgi:predicted MPP superfamily phosphohydrolase
MEISALYKIYEEHPVVTTDSRVCPKGSIFFALKGERFNGNLFAESALERGCAYAVVDEWDKNRPEDPRVIVVENVLETLQKLANFHRKKLKITIVGITGTNGKTTTKELVAAILSKEFKVAFTQGNYNNHIGVPLTLLSINRSHEIGVIEMGANHPGEIGELCEIAEPNFGLITNIGTAHIEGFGSLENVIRTKCELYDFIRAHEGKVFVNKDNPILREKSEGMDRILYGRDDPTLFVSGTLSAETPFLQPDLILFVGDILDSRIEPVEQQRMDKELRRLDAPLGIYSCTGNHEYRYEGERKIGWLNDAGITMLRDSAVLVDSSFYVVGREDLVIPDRQSLVGLLDRQEVDRSLPLIVLNHTPNNLDEEVDAGADIALYGHTHQGQAFPGNLATRMAFEVAYGYLKKGNTHIYVTSGLGLAGPQFRIGTVSEVVVLHVKFRAE